LNNEGKALLSAVFSAFMQNGANMFIATRLAPTEAEHISQYYSFMHPKPYSVVVDLGCGSGECGALLQGIDPTLRVINVVNDQALIDYMVSKRRICINSSFENTPLPDGCADYVMFNESIGYGDLDAVFQEAHRLLQDGGVVTIKDFTVIDPLDSHVFLENWSYTIRQPSEYIAAAYRSGFSVEAMLHPPSYTKHWFEIMEQSEAAKESALRHDPKNLPLCTVLYRLVKGKLSGRSADQ
jgi:SAM-dependent methyltransferase